MVSDVAAHPAFRNEFPLSASSPDFQTEGQGGVVLREKGMGRPGAAVKVTTAPVRSRGVWGRRGAAGRGSGQHR